MRCVCVGGGGGERISCDTVTWPHCGNVSPRACTGFLDLPYLQGDSHAELFTTQTILILLHKLSNS